MKKLLLKWDPTAEPAGLHDRREVPADVLADQFDWLPESDPAGSTGFMRRNDEWYHVSQFMAVPAGSALEQAGWMGWHSDSFFSGIAVWLSCDGEHYKLAFGCSRDDDAPEEGGWYWPETHRPDAVLAY